MRIIGGTAGGTILKVPKGYDVRPTPDRVRLALFNSLAERVQGGAVLELFAGTGAFSLECLSRGATSAVCVEKSAKHARILRENLTASRLPRGGLSIRVQDAFTAVSQLAVTDARFAIVFADPPYGEKNLGRRSESLAQKTLDDPLLPDLVAEGGMLILGHTRRDTLTLPSTWREIRMLRHGDTVMRLLGPVC